MQLEQEPIVTKLKEYSPAIWRWSVERLDHNVRAEIGGAGANRAWGAASPGPRFASYPAEMVVCASVLVVFLIVTQLTLVRLLNCHAKSLLPNRTLRLSGLNHRLALVVANREVSAMCEKERYSVIIECCEDRGFAVLVSRIHVCAKPQQLLLHVREEGLM